MLRFTRHGWREMMIGAVVLAALGTVLGLIRWPLALLVLPVLVWLFAFFRDPERTLPDDPRAMVSPADGTVTDVIQIEHEPLLDGAPAVRIGIFLSVFNVHINRAPCAGRVTLVKYHKGKFINAMSSQRASEENESNTLVIAVDGQPAAAVKQISGLIARRIICTAQQGHELSRGQRIGMIKFGSRTELYIAQRLHPQVSVQVGQRVRGGADVLATLQPAEVRV